MSNLVLKRGDVLIGARPDLGGALTSFSWRGHHVLRESAEDVSDPVEAAMFPIAPFVNRIALGRFSWSAREVALTPNYRDEPHALHGQAWQRPWRVDHYDDTHLRMSFDHEPAEWPWAYSFVQDIVLKEAGASFTLRLINRSEQPMPASFGFHPYFCAKRASWLKAEINEMWSTDVALIPTSQDLPIIPLQQGAPLKDAPLIDNTFTGWCGHAVIRRNDIAIDIGASPVFSFFHLYAPHEDYFCAEPVSAMPNALNRPDVEPNGVHVLGAGESLSGDMDIRVQAM